MKLHELGPTQGKGKDKKRKGRGISSGLGKTSGRGQKGQKARSKVRIGFEGGQMPLYRRIPKRGFTNIFRKEYAIINIKDLEVFDDGTEITPEFLKERGFFKDMKDGVKILGNGEITKKLNVKAHKFSKTAEERITASGGKVEVI